jgi:hypothetical protein
MNKTISEGKIKICDENFRHIEGGSIDHKSFDLRIENRESISLFIFNSLMFPVESKRNGEEKYKLEGPKLGFYHDTVDVREGPYVNHYINKLQISVKYDKNSALFSIKGTANLLDSSFDKYWYKGKASGLWCFESEFIHVFN